MKYLLIYQARTTVRSVAEGTEKDRIAAVATVKMTDKQYRKYGGRTSKEPRLPAQRNSPFGWLAMATDGKRKITFNYCLDPISESEYETYKMFKFQDGVVEHNENKDGPIFVCHVSSKHLEEIERYSNRPDAFKEPR